MGGKCTSRKKERRGNEGGMKAQSERKKQNGRDRSSRKEKKREGGLNINTWEGEGKKEREEHGIQGGRKEERL